MSKALSNTSVELHTPRASWRFHVVWAVLMVVAGSLYVSQYWTPSSYAWVLRQMGAPEQGLVFGQPRQYRADEYGVVTPLTVATVRNGFERYNKTSWYAEDLRINYGLPIHDWGLLFKPTMWGYGVLDPARAFSLHWFATLALFLVGHALLFRRLGLRDWAAAWLALGLYFTPFVQFWWNEKGPVFAFFPWVVGALLGPMSPWLRLTAFYWLAVSWLLTNFYPPIAITLGFVGAVLVAAFEPGWLRWRRLMPLLLTAAAAGGTAALYLQDYLVQTAATLYPGSRRVGGGSLPGIEWWAQWLPFVTFDARFDSLTHDNICEVGAMGAALLLMTLCFVDGQSLRMRFASDPVWRRGVLVWACGLAAMQAWMLLPLSPGIGALLLWDRVPPERMAYGAGWLLLVGAVVWTHDARWVVSPRRWLIYCSVLLTLWVGLHSVGFTIMSPRNALKWLLLRSADLSVLVLLPLALLVARRWQLSKQSAVLAASTAAGAVALAGFNPIQSAQPIFHPPDAPVLRALKWDVLPSGVLASAALPGAVFNGLGYRSVNHVNAVPALQIWRERYPELPADQFGQLFNRYAHVHLVDGLAVPRLVGPDRIGIPLADFWPNRWIHPAGSPHQGNEAAWLAQGEQARGEVTTGRSGESRHAGVYIGTGTSPHLADGQLTLALCAASGCATGAALLNDAAHNGFLHVGLDQPLLTEAGSPVRYTITLSGGTHPVALWTYPESARNAAPLMLGSRRIEGRTPRLLLDYGVPSNP